MPSTATLAPICCFDCNREVAYCAPGESVRIHQRARVYCVLCKDLRGPLPKREVEYLYVARNVRLRKGSTPMQSEIAEEMGISTSRAQNIASTLRRRGYDDELYRALHGRDPATHRKVDDALPMDKGV